MKPESASPGPPRQVRRDAWLKGPVTRVLRPGEQESREKEMPKGPDTSGGLMGGEVRDDPMELSNMGHAGVPSLERIQSGGRGGKTTGTAPITKEPRNRFLCPWKLSTR